MESGESKDHTRSWGGSTHTQPELFCQLWPRPPHTLQLSCTSLTRARVPARTSQRTGRGRFVYKHLYSLTTQENKTTVRQRKICSGVMWKTDDDRTLTGFSYVPLRKESGFSSILENCSLDETHRSEFEQSLNGSPGSFCGITCTCRTSQSPSLPPEITTSLPPTHTNSYFSGLA